MNKDYFNSESVAIQLSVCSGNIVFPKQILNFVKYYNLQFVNWPAQAKLQIHLENSPGNAMCVPVSVGNNSFAKVCIDTERVSLT